MILTLTVLAAALLALERIGYILIWHHPDRFARLCRRWHGPEAEPLKLLEALFVFFKLLQISVFIGWFMVFGDGLLPLPTAPLPALTLGIALLLAGQILNFSVFWKLGRVGVFYGNKLGHEVPWVRGFPFSLVAHPQYTGTLISIWGLFLVMRYPHPDWIILPLISTVYYLAAMRLEG
jgi:methylene-fatty-acyl-phospholipid synthase